MKKNHEQRYEFACGVKHKLGRNPKCEKNKTNSAPANVVWIM